MKLFKNKGERKSFTISMILHIVLLLFFIFFGLKYYDPKPEEGIMVNFGYSSEGTGTIEAEPTKVSPKIEAEPVTETQVITQDFIDAPSIDNPEKKTEKKPKEDKPDEVQPEKKPTPTDNLQDMLSAVESSEDGGEGITGKPGNQGDPNGDINSTSRVGTGGGGNGTGNYLLGGRNALDKPKPVYECGNDKGRVVVKIYVDQNGKVVRAEPGEKIPGGAASTTTSSCLYAKSKSAALRTKWQSDSNAPDLQIGYIIYNFSKE